MCKIKRIEILRKNLELQKQALHIFPDSYMIGLYNGLELALAILEDREPKFQNKASTLIEKVRKVKNK